MRIVRGLLLAPALKLLNRLLKHDGNSVIIGGPLGWTWEDTIDDAHHGSRGSGLHADSHVRQHDHSLVADGSPIAVSGVPNLPASAITSGVFPVVRGGTGLSTIALGGILYASALDTLSRLAPTAANQVLRATAADALQIAALLAADIPNLDAAKITSGRFGVSRLGWTLNKLLKGAGVDANPAEIDVPAGIPSGLIAMWHGLIANIPSGWVICDGNASTPNLLAKFVKGVATAATNPGATGGASTHTLTIAEMPAHTHFTSSPTPDGATLRVTYMGAAPPTQFPTSSTGDSGAHENQPAFYAIAFIMKT